MLYETYANIQLALVTDQNKSMLWGTCIILDTNLRHLYAYVFWTLDYVSVTIFTVWRVGIRELRVQFDCTFVCMYIKEVVKKILTAPGNFYTRLEGEI